MLLHWLNWHDPHALEQSSPCLASQCEACSCTLAMGDLQQILWVWVLLCHHRQQDVLCIRNAPTPISVIHCFLVPHPCHNLKIGPGRMIFHSTCRRREFLRFLQMLLRRSPVWLALYCAENAEIDHPCPSLAQQCPLTEILQVNAGRVERGQWFALQSLSPLM